MKVGRSGHLLENADVTNWHKADMPIPPLKACFHG